jgi:hypothetical protein
MNGTTIRCQYCNTSIIFPEELQVHEQRSGSFIRLESSLMRQIEGLIRSGRKIEACRLFRQATNVGLKAAKDAVEGMEVAIVTSDAGNINGFHPIVALPAMSRYANLSGK